MEAFFSEQYKCISDCEKGHNLMKGIKIEESADNQIEVVIDNMGVIYDCFINNKRVNGDPQCLFEPFDVLLLKKGDFGIESIDTNGINGKLRRISLNPGYYCIFRVFDFMIRFKMTDEMKLHGNLQLNVCLSSKNKECEKLRNYTCTIITIVLICFSFRNCELNPGLMVLLLHKKNKYI